MKLRMKMTVEQGFDKKDRPDARAASTSKKLRLPASAIIEDAPGDNGVRVLTMTHGGITRELAQVHDWPKYADKLKALGYAEEVD